MDIAALSIGMSASQLHTDVGVAVLSKSLDQIDATGDGIQKILEASVTPNLGQNIDYMV